MMSIVELIKIIEKGKHPACQDCPWNPNLNKKYPSDFGSSCVLHGIDWSKSRSAVSMLIAQDPAGTTPAKTGSLCGYCNARFSTDHSAQHGYLLWKAAISLAESGPAAYRYMSEHYWTNAIMHGVKVDKNDKNEINENERQRKQARFCCESILLEQINLLSPRVIIVTGTYAADSMFHLGLISKSWNDFKNQFSHQVYSEQITLSSGIKSTIYCTYHASATAVNTHVARMFTEETNTLLTQKIEQLPNSIPAQHFMRQFQGIRGEDKGMKVLLLHWLEIGEGIRRANNELNL